MKRYWFSIVSAAVVIFMALFMRDFVREGIIIPFFKIVNFFQSFPQEVLWFLFLGIVVYAAAKSLKNWEIQTLNYDPESYTVSGPITIKTNASGSRGRLFIKLDYNREEFVSHHLYYHYSTSPGNSSYVHNLWETIPEHRFIYRIRYTLVESFSIWSMFKYQSPAFWNDYRNVDEQSEGKYSAHLSEVMSLYLAVNKWLWKKQIKVDVIFRNIFNRKNIYFPIGASLDLRFYAQAEIYFNFM